MLASNTVNGKGFEYACLKAFGNALSNCGGQATIFRTQPLVTAEGMFLSLTQGEQNRYLQAANTACSIIFPLEPCLVNVSGPVELSINPNSVAVGANGDVRDVMLVRRNGMQIMWEIGLSCKHNHEALKHPRITADKDFGTNWIGIPCSQEFISEVGKVVDQLSQFGADGVTWRAIAPSDDIKQDRYYYPILSAYRDELIRLCQTNPGVPARLLSYFFGSQDFYKVIMNEDSGTTTVEAFNMSGTLGARAGAIKPATKVPQIKMPTRLIEADFKPNSKTTLILVFDGGWTVSMRLHNKDKIAKPTSLAWDVQLVGLPTGIFSDTRPW